GASSAAGGGGFLVLTGPFTLASAAPASKLTGYVQGGSSAANVRAVIYADNGSNAPGSFVAVSSQVAVAAGQAAGWVDFSFPVAPNLSAGKYWLGYWLGGTVIVFYDNQANAGRYRAATYLASGDPPASFGSGTATTLAMSIYATLGAGTAAPTNTALPVITGTPTQGETLQTDNGSWTGSPSSFTYQWRSCDASGNACTD